MRKIWTSHNHNYCDVFLSSSHPHIFGGKLEFEIFSGAGEIDGFSGSSACCASRATWAGSPDPRKKEGRCHSCRLATSALEGRDRWSQGIFWLASQGKWWVLGSVSHPVSQNKTKKQITTEVAHRGRLCAAVELLPDLLLWLIYLLGFCQVDIN